MKKWNLKISLAIALLFVSMAMVTAVPLVMAGDIKVITAKDTPDESLDEKSVKEMFLGRLKFWPQGGPVEVVVLKKGDAHNKMVESYLKKSTSQFKTYWKKVVFSGKGKLPKSFKTEEELVKYVADKPGRIGYVSGATDLSETKILSEK